MEAWKQWLALGGYAQNAQTDFPQKLRIFESFLRQPGGRDGHRLIDLDGRIELAAIDATVLGEYQSFVFEYIGPRTGRKLTTQSQIHALSYVQSFLRFLKRTGRLALDPGQVIRLPRASQSLPAALLTPAEMRRLLAQPDLRSPLGFRNRVIFEVFWSTGMRIGELLALTAADLDFEQALCAIRHGKGDKPRVVPLGQGTIVWLHEYLDHVRPVLARQAKPSASPLSTINPQLLPIFLSRLGRPMVKVGLQSQLRTYAQRAGIKKRITTHSFRHTLASEMLQAGADLRHIQELLGHASLTTTQRYLHIVKTELKKVHARTHPRERTPPAPVRYRGARED